MNSANGILLKNSQEIAVLYEVNQIAAQILSDLEPCIVPGVITFELEEFVCRECKRYGVYPAFKGYMGYPYALCCSINHEVVHGLPSMRKVLDGDIVSIDFGVSYKGFFGDLAKTYSVGLIDKGAAHLLEICEFSLLKGIEQAISGNDLYDISRAVQVYVEEHGCSVIRRFVGHGIGRSLHEKPIVPNFVPQNTSRVSLKPGMVLAIEPVVSAGSGSVEILSNGWTAVTKDRSLSAHFEHSVALTSHGPIILSKLQ